LKRTLDITVVVSIASPEMQKEAGLYSGGMKEFEEMTEKSLKENWKYYNFDLIITPPDLTLPQSFNSVKDKIKTKYIAFLHHDLLFLEGGQFLGRCVDYMESLHDCGIAGVCGKTFMKPDLEDESFNTWEFTDGYTIGYGLYQQVYEQQNKKILFKGKYYHGTQTWGHPIDKPMECQTLDGMVMIIPTEVFKKIQFDEIFKYRCDCMCEDYCLMVKYYLNLKVYVLPLVLWHRPNWKRPPNFESDYLNEKHLEAIRLLGEKWKGKVSCILSTSFWSGKNIFDWDKFMEWINSGMPRDSRMPQCY